jgi:hypothetical protein
VPSVRIQKSGGNKHLKEFLFIVGSRVAVLRSAFSFIMSSLNVLVKRLEHLDKQVPHSRLLHINKHVTRIVVLFFRYARSLLFLS